MDVLTCLEVWPEQSGFVVAGAGDGVGVDVGAEGVVVAGVDVGFLGVGKVGDFGEGGI